MRYYSAWAEDNHMIIQNEYCNGGNLSRKVAENREHGLSYSEGELKHLMRHLVKVRAYVYCMHSIYCMYVLANLSRLLEYGTF